MGPDGPHPVWSAQFAAESLRELTSAGPLGAVTRDWAGGGSTGRGVRVAVVDSGIEQNHPALGDSVRGGVIVSCDERTRTKIRIDPDDRPRDMFGHGTACAGILHGLAPKPNCIACASWAAT